MNEMRKNTRLIALILVVIMSFSLLVGCMPNVQGSGSGENKEPNGNGNNEGGNTNKVPTDDTHTCVFGNWVMIKTPTNTEDGLQERECECGTVEQRVVKASGGDYTIHYDNLKTAEYPAKTGYNSSEGLLSLPKPSAEGYKFLGWYTASVGGDIVDYIPQGSTGNYVLFAHWELVTYDITYKNVPNNTNPTTYNIESKLKLESPKWSGLEFTHWSDESGNKYIPDINITSLPENMSGDLILTANWKVLRNIARPAAENGELYRVFSGEEGMLYFHYDLGTIEHVVLDDINTSNLYYKSEGMAINLTLSNTVTISEEKAESISNTVSQSISKTDSWGKSYSKAETHSDHWNANIGGGIEAGIGGGTQSGVNGEGSTNGDNWIKKIGASISEMLNFSVKAHIEGSYEWGKENSTTEEWGSSESHSTETSETQSETVTSSLAYKKEITSTIEENYPISADLPSGYYARVHGGNVRVIAIVTYEIATGYMYLNTYCRLDNMHSMVMYYPTVNEMNNPKIEGLDFDIPEDEIVNFIENSYYVKYDANGGEGEMPITLHSVGGNEQLAKNEFTKAGCAFAGWELETDDGIIVLQDEQSITDLSKALETITLKARWIVTETVWVEKESGSFYFAAFPSGFDKDHSIYKSMQKEAYTDYETETTKRVVTIEKVGYVYWHWMYDTSANAGDRVIYYKEGSYAYTSSMDPFGYHDFGAFTSTKDYTRTTSNRNQPTPDYYWYKVSDKTSNADTQGSYYWYRFEYYVCKYTDYVVADQ